MEPLVSILIPAYNAEKWISETIESALGQSWPNKEIVVVDDGSTDRTLSVAKSFSCKALCVISQPNQGAAAARNNAFSSCQGNYIQWLDADDLLAPHKISRQMKALESCKSENTVLSSAWGKFYYSPSKARFSPSPLWCDLSPIEWLVRKMGQNCYMQTATWLISRELTTAAGPWDTRLFSDDDGEFFCRVLSRSCGIKFVPEAKVYYRHRNRQTLSYVGRCNQKLDALFLAIRLHVAHLRSLEESQRTALACVTYLQKYMFDFVPERPDLVEKMRDLAAEFGGSLEVPRASGKYAWIERVFGWSVAKHAQIKLPAIKHYVKGFWDKTTHHRSDQGILTEQTDVPKAL